RPQLLVAGHELAGARGNRYARHQLTGLEGVVVNAVGDEELVHRQGPRPAPARELNLGAERDEHRRHVRGMRRDAAATVRHHVAMHAVLLEAEAERLTPEERLVVVGAARIEA